jgi:hypothetical protein
VTRNTSGWIALIGPACLVSLAACGGSGSGTTPSAAASTPTPTAAVATPTAAAASAQCPSSATVGSALGITVPAAVVVPNGSGPSLPGGATGIACDYHGTADNVIIELITNINPSAIALYSAHFPGGYKNVSGVGDQARSFFQTLGGGKDNEGLVATKGSTLVSIAATATPASLSQVEALVNQLL